MTLSHACNTTDKKTQQIKPECKLLSDTSQQLMTPADHYLNATGAAFDILKSESQLSGAIFGEVAMTCLVTMVVLLVAVNGKTKTPLAPFLVGCTVIINILAG